MSDQTFGRAARAAWDEMHRRPRYSVWHTTGKRDGDSAWNDIDDAMAEFDAQVARTDVVEVELIDNNDPATSVVIRRHAAVQ
jgi:hypothetical protein